MNKYITDPADQKRLEQLSSKIEDNYANYDDYVEYETILEKYPPAYQKVMDKLRQEGIFSIKDLYKMKEAKRSSMEAWRIAGVIGALVGITAGLIMLSRKK